MTLYPVILAGDRRTDSWPLSRETHPRRFLPIVEGRSPFQATLKRLQALGRARPATVVASAEHRFLVADQARAMGHALRRLYVEPCGRGTAPAIGVVAHELAQDDPDATLLVLPGGHDILDTAAFVAAVNLAGRAAVQGRLALFGVAPRGPETRYGYIECGAGLAAAPGCHAVAAFVEKPEPEIAARLAQSGRHYWNSGIFLFRARTFIEELERLDPGLDAACRRAARSARIGAGAVRALDPEALEGCHAASFDRAVLERTRLAAMVPARFGWSDGGLQDIEVLAGAHPGEDDIVRVADAHPHTPQGA